LSTTLIVQGMRVPGAYVMRVFTCRHFQDKTHIGETNKEIVKGE